MEDKSVKRISVNLLRVGMYISDLNRDWIPHNTQKRKGLIKSEETIEKIRRLGVTELYIDTSKGIDSQDAVPVQELEAQQQHELEELGAENPNYAHRVPFEEERVKAEALHEQARKMVENMLGDVKLGRKLDLENFDVLAEGMLDSIFRNQSALACLGRIREKDSYLMEHSVNLGVLMSIFGRFRKLDRSLLHQVMVGALLHDIGKVLIPDRILHKPARLSDDEFEVMKSHVAIGTKILEETPGMSELAILVQSQHHEKIDGSGYPLGLKQEDISEYGRMAAITDVYDAITADRVYHRGMIPTVAMKKLLEWSENHLDRKLVREFIKCMGIYPIGSLVELASKKLAVVVEVNEHSQEKPVVKEIYSLFSHSHLTPRIVNLDRPGCQDRVIRAVNPEDYYLSVNNFL